MNADWPTQRGMITCGRSWNRGPIQTACLFACLKYKEMYGNIEGLHSVNLYVMSTYVKAQNKLKPTSVVLLVLSFLWLKMANLSDLVGFTCTLSVTTRYKK